MWLATVSSKVQPDPWAPPECLRQVRQDRRDSEVQAEGSLEREPKDLRERPGWEEVWGPRDPLDFSDRRDLRDMWREWPPRV